MVELDALLLASMTSIVQGTWVATTEQWREFPLDHYFRCCRLLPVLYRLLTFICWIRRGRAESTVPPEFCTPSMPFAISFITDVSDPSVRGGPLSIITNFWWREKRPFGFHARRYYQIPKAKYFAKSEQFPLQPRMRKTTAKSFFALGLKHSKILQPWGSYIRIDWLAKMWPASFSLSRLWRKLCGCHSFVWKPFDFGSSVSVFLCCCCLKLSPWSLLRAARCPPNIA